MRKLILVVAILLMTATFAKCDPVDLEGKINLPEAKAGAIYIPEEGTVNACAMATLLEYNVPKIGAKLDLDAIYGIDNKAGAGIALELGSLSNIPGLDVPFAEYVDMSIGAGCIYDFNSEQTELAFYATAVQIQF